MKIVNPSVLRFFGYNAFAGAEVDMPLICWVRALWWTWKNRS